MRIIDWSSDVCSSDLAAAGAAKAARRASALASDTTNISAASPDSGRNSPTDIRLLFTIAAESARCRTGGPPDAILGSGQIFESEGARAPVVRSKIGRAHV